MKKITGILVLAISMIVLLTAMNQSFINRIKQDRYFDHLNNDHTPRSLYHRFFVRSDRWAYGDLYGLCYLPQYRFKLEPFKKYNSTSGANPQNRVLYIIGDSFLADKTLTSAFDGFDKVIFLDRRFPFGPLRLDSTQQNFLIMEFAERNLNGYVMNKTDEIKANPSVSPSLLNRLGNIIFNKDLSRNLELLLFDDKLFTPIKELKASLNYNLFGRVAKEVAVSTDKKRLLLNITVDTSDIHSAFRYKTARQIDTITANLKEAKNYYEAIGFKKVFLSIVPNPVSIYDENRMPYNHLLERIEEQTDLPLISIYKTFKSDQHNLYFLSDAHWNPLGFDIWIRQVNRTLKSANTKLLIQ
ncbi:hypothetical protein SAMN05421821_10974 [Mucilaginibacter lappiensis]|uniref:SGNH hydrolase-like domain-containing protein, acetyltransferase AlgX n=1 Tax=Mucilaginibacter lappiensis TaxID=354630 RepID=A0ABR6PRK5_9SPHI|nr:hypothetical protein [Mucilaginibacter lappiensis]MBB6110911.1 hypothetical protein [Mucilaginibacter lappiensis]SIR60811.1 hypothetical protein SAMN05421821_10974 [Mucilaginibacter lappiensis]